MDDNTLAEKLYLMPENAAQLRFPGRYMIFTKDPDDLTIGYDSESIRIRITDPPALSENMQEIWSARYARKFPEGVERNGKFPGMLEPGATVGMLELNLFQSGFLDWNLTLPQGDGYDSRLERDCMRPFFNIHHVPITADGYMLYAARNKRRISWHDTLLCTHSWGSDVDKDQGCDEVLNDLDTGQGRAMLRQARDGVRREINPFQDSGSPKMPNNVIRELLAPDDVHVRSANCLTVPHSARDLGYHLCFTAHIDKEAGWLIEQRKRYPFEGRIADLFSVEFTEDSMVGFFQDYKDRIAMTVEPALIMACVQEFGEEFLDHLPYGSIRNR